jgi:quinol monooxygenase YgiN
MTLVVNATWTIKEGSEAIVWDALSELAPASRAEPGCLYYLPYRDPDEPRVVRLFEVYADEDAYRAHGQSAHFQQLVLARAVPALEKRERAVFEAVDV